MTQKGMGALLAGAIVTALTACGGGGGGGGGGGFVPLPAAPAPAPAPAPASAPAPTAQATDPDIVNTASVAGRCASPRSGTADVSGTLLDEKRWVRSWINDTYLWYDEVPTRSAADYATPIDYFGVLKTSALTSSGKPKDRFHFTYDTAAYLGLSNNGQEIGYGLRLAYLSSVPPRDVRVAYVEPNSPASAAGVTRGMSVRTVDGIDVTNGSNVDGLNAGLAPQKSGEVHQLGLRRLDGSDFTLTLTATAIASRAVMNVKTIPTASGNVGYLQFNQHSIAAEAQLMDAITNLRDAAVADLVLDMRYNGGGLLGIAAELGSMIAPTNSTTGQTFERLVYNRKNPFGTSASASRVPFYSTAQYGSRAGSPLPRLNLPRVLVLAGGDTCSASESVVNGLRGIGVNVALVGGTTCGKPYGFYPQDNCGTTYFSIQFQGVNAKGEGDYADGLAPTCSVADDFSHALGDPAEARLAAALSLRQNGVCPTPVTAFAASAGSVAGGSGTGRSPNQAVLGSRAPWLDNRIVLPQDLGSAP
ncbi:S41 family peptidase [Pseudacidovorax sp. RU35E]|uniref:S41 family peptidase n=1 Tax=Pseudacidovorax sp. RU35E TaxID=1907403 RepID=UPI0009573933|nr:S41 family peptidase [Pseudacidovorax sp. RU35E]SIQ35557.1 C-terminal processing protease CtpA/Prc, contains a PDZ domain [Pseudacidovorax sp. RU35E]